MVVRNRPGGGLILASVRQGETEAEGKEWYSSDELWRWLGTGRTKTYELLQTGGQGTEDDVMWLEDRLP